MLTIFFSILTRGLSKKKKKFFMLYLCNGYTDFNNRGVYRKSLSF